MITKDDFYKDLEHIKNDCCLPNWDSYDALPISKKTIEVAKKFIEVLPEKYIVPEVAPDCQGEINFDWIRGNEYLVSVSIDDEGGCAVVAYGKIIKLNEKFNGDKIHQELLDLLPLKSCGHLKK